MTFREPWFLLGLITAQRIHMNDQPDADGRPVWRTCADASERLVAMYPDSTRNQVLATLLHRSLEGNHSVRHLIQARISGGVIATVRAVHEAGPNTYLTGDAARVRTAIVSLRQDRLRT